MLYLFNSCLIVIQSVLNLRISIVKNMEKTRSGEHVSAQIGKMGVVAQIDSGFSLPDGQCFNIKNDGIAPVTLSVRLAGMPDGDFIETQFDCGWNPEIVKEIAPTVLDDINLKWGF